MKSSDTVMGAVKRGDLIALKKLIKSGADVNELDEEMPLAKAAELGRADIVRELLQAGADPNLGGLQAPICVAVAARKVPIVDLLLKADKIN